MELSLTERKVLAAVELSAHASVAEIARATGLRAQSIHRSIASLRRRGIIQPAATISLFALGLQEYALHLSLAPERRRDEEKFIKRCVESERVIYVCELGGTYQYSLVVCARNYQEVQAFLQELTDEFGSIFFEKQVSGVLSLTDYGVKVLHPPGTKPKPICVGLHQPPMKINSLDFQILQAIAKQPDLGTSAVARIVRAPTTSVGYRLQQLRNGGVLLGTRFIVYSDTLGLSAFRFLIRTRGFTTEHRRRFQRFCEQNAGIAFVVEYLGGWDYEIGIRVRKSDDARELNRELHSQFGEALNSVELLSSFRLLKLSRFPFAALSILG